MTKKIKNETGPNRAITQKWSGKINFLFVDPQIPFDIFFFSFLNEKILIHYHFPIFDSFSSSSLKKKNAFFVVVVII
jgi:hypothetical protein